MTNYRIIKLKYSTFSFVLNNFKINFDLILNILKWAIQQSSKYNFYISQVLTPEQHDQAEKSEYNFDHSDAFDWTLACKTLRKLKNGKSAKVIQNSLFMLFGFWVVLFNPRYASRNSQCGWVYSKLLQFLSTSNSIFF